MDNKSPPPLFLAVFASGIVMDKSQDPVSGISVPDPQLLYKNMIQISPRQASVLVYLPFTLT
jgi:hypothetical protein